MAGYSYITYICTLIWIIELLIKQQSILSKIPNHEKETKIISTTTKQLFKKQKAIFLRLLLTNNNNKTYQDEEK